jgi:hypothetical protein
MGLQEGRAEWQESEDLSIELQSHLYFLIFGAVLHFEIGAYASARR